MGVWKETFIAESRDLQWMGSSLLASVDVMKLQITEVTISLGLTGLWYNALKDSDEGKEKVTVRTRANNCIDSENRKCILKFFFANILDTHCI